MSKLQGRDFQTALQAHMQVAERITVVLNFLRFILSIAIRIAQWLSRNTLIPSNVLPMWHTQCDSGIRLQKIRQVNKLYLFSAGAYLTWPFKLPQKGHCRCILHLFTTVPNKASLRTLSVLSFLNCRRMRALSSVGSNTLEHVLQMHCSVLMVILK